MPSTATQEEKTGVIEAFYATDTGGIREDVSGAPRDFYQPGASVDFVIGDAVSYTLITTPNGRVVVAGVRKPHN